LLYSENNTNSASHSQPSLNDRLNYFNKELTATKSEMVHLRSDMAHLEKNLTAQISVLSTTLESRLDKFENRFLFQILFIVSCHQVHYMLVSNNYTGFWCDNSGSGQHHYFCSHAIPGSYHPDSSTPYSYSQRGLKQERVSQVLL
jgi:hypothetical protein